MAWFGRRHSGPTTPAEQEIDPALAATLRAMRLATEGPQPTGEGEAMTPGSVAATSHWLQQEYRAGRYDAAFRRRVELGYGVRSENVPQADWFWFNAAPALSALKSGMREHPVTAMCCGVAEQSMDSSDPAQVAAVDEFNRLYHG